MTLCFSFVKTTITCCQYIVDASSLFTFCALVLVIMMVFLVSIKFSSLFAANLSTPSVIFLIGEYFLKYFSQEEGNHIHKAKIVSMGVSVFFLFFIQCYFGELLYRMVRQYSKPRLYFKDSSL